MTAATVERPQVATEPEGVTELPDGARKPLSVHVAPGAHIADPYDPAANGTTFDALAWLATIDPRAMRLGAGMAPVRRALTSHDPALFVVTYLSGLLTDDDGVMSFNDMTLDLFRWARTLVRKPGPRESRNGFIAPRESGKSTVLFKCLPVWLAAHKHARFFAAFSASAAQAERHLAGVRTILTGNAALAEDYPELCKLTKDAGNEIGSADGFGMVAKGVDAASLGLVDANNRRPDVILLDDIDLDGGVYSPFQADKRRESIVTGVLGMSERAHTVLVGTTTQRGSVMDQLVRAQAHPDLFPWVREERFKVRRYEPLPVDGQDTPTPGRVRSFWPAKWPVAYLQSIAGTHSYQLNFANSTEAADSLWWRPTDVVYDSRPRYDRTVLAIDGAVTAKETSDETGLCVAGLAAAEKKIFIREALGVRQSGEDLRGTVLELIARFDVDYIVCESNNGGDLWRQLLHDMPVKLVLVHATETKRYRIRRLLTTYQRAGQPVRHERPLPALEHQQRDYPNVSHDDVVDAEAAVVQHLLMILLRAAGNNGQAQARQVQRTRA